MKKLMFIATALLIVSGQQAFAAGTKTASCRLAIHLACKTIGEVKNINELSCGSAQMITSNDLSAVCTEQGTCEVKFSNDVLSAQYLVGQSGGAILIEDKVTGQSQTTWIDSSSSTPNTTAALLNKKGGLVGNALAYGIVFGCELK